MLLAERATTTLHHGDSSRAGAEREERDALHGRVPGDPPPQPELFQLKKEEPGGERPEAFTEPRPQERVQRHTLEKMIESFVSVPMLDLDALVPSAAPVGGCPAELRHVLARRAGDRCAHDQSPGRAGCRGVPCSANRRWQSSW